jgi:hypothetical protein
MQQSKSRIDLRVFKQFLFAEEPFALQKNLGNSADGKEKGD